jgi:hypothetical protein
MGEVERCRRMAEIMRARAKRAPSQTEARSYIEIAEGLDAVANEAERMGGAAARAFPTPSPPKDES